MSYLVLARKWRPRGFQDLTGQEHVVRVLANSILQGKTPHAYVFSGPRGVGKTSTARIFAKAMNCEKGPTPEPCGTCAFCTSIAEGRSVDVIEIDGASNNSVDDIRDLRERVKYAPAGGRYKVYIIDETHMLSPSAFNALLKTLEEPPSHVLFVLATTAPSKIPLTVMSRCQHLPFKRIPVKVIKERLRLISDTEKMNITDGALSMIARAADGSMRDSLTILDQVASFADKVTEDEVKALIGVSDFGAVSEAAEAVLSGNRKHILGIVCELMDRGTDLRTFTKDLIKFFRDLLVVKLVNGSSSLDEVIDASEEEIGRLISIANGTSEEHLSLVLSELIKAENEVKTSFSPRVALEMALIRISYLDAFKSVKDALKALQTMGCKPLPVETQTPSVEYETEREPAPSIKEELSGPDEAVPEPPPAENLSPLPDELDGDSLLKYVTEKIEDPRITSKLLNAKPEISGDKLILTFNSSEAEICAKPLMENPGEIAKAASEVLGRPTSIDIRVVASKTPRKKDLKEMALSEPSVRKTLDMFDGKMVDVRRVEE